MGTTRRVFLSRTYEFEAYPPGGSYVAAAATACTDAECIPVDMSDWTAAPHPPVDECRRRVRDCDVYVGIVGFNYGSPVAEQPSLSYTELEYETAVSANLPRLVFLLAGDALIPLELALGHPELAARQRAFRRLLEDGVTVRQFRNPDELRRVLANALRQLPALGRAGGEPDRGTPELPSARIPPFMAPTPTEPLVERPVELEAVLRQVREAGRAEGKEPEGTPLVALRGMGGFGKTTLAAEACRRLRSDFPAGVLWVSLGPEPTERRLVDWCGDLVQLLGGQPGHFRDPGTAGDYLGSVLGDRQALLVIDDVWRLQDLKPFLRGAPRTVRLVTTRVGSAVPRRTSCVHVDQLSPFETEALLGRDVAASDVDWSDLIRRTGRWPLLAGLVNGALRDRIDAGQPPTAAAEEVGRELAAGGPASLDPNHEDQRDRAVAATVELSLGLLERRLGPDAVARYRDLAILLGEDVPLDLLGRWRGLSEFDLSRLGLQLRELSLVQAYDAAARTVRLHAVLRGYLLSTEPDAAQRSRHAALLAAHRPSSGRWAELAGEVDYLWRCLVWHLQSAGLDDELVATLRDVAFLSRAVQHSGTSAVLDQFDGVKDPAVEELRAWVRRWSHLLAGLPSAEDVATTLLARPGAMALLVWTDAPVPPALRYADGWACPEPAGSALDRVVGRHPVRVHSLAWHPDGERLAAAGGDGLVRIWRPHGTADPQRVPYRGWVRAVAWSSDGRWLACGDDEGGLCLVAFGGDLEPIEMGRQDSGVRAVAWASRVPAVATAGDGGAWVWTSESLSAAARWTSRIVRGGIWVRCVAWSPTGELLAFGDDEGAVSTWSAGDNSVEVLGHHEGEVFTIAWSSRNELASGGADGVLALWRRDGGVSRRDLGRIGTPLVAVSWSPDGNHVVTGGADGSVRVWDLDGVSEPIGFGCHDRGALAVAWHPTRAELASGGGDGEIRLWRVDGDHGALDLRGPSARVGALAWSASGRFLAVVTGDGAVRVWPDSGGDEPVEVSPHVKASPAIAWIGDRVATGSDDGAVRVWGLGSTDSPAIEVIAPGRGVRALAGSPDGTRLACVGGDGSLQVWLVGEKSASVVLPRRGEAARSVAWSPEGRLVVTGDDDGAIRLWDLNGDAGPDVMRAHATAVRAVAFSPDGGRLVSGDDLGALCMWNLSLRRGRDVGRHDDALQAVGFSPDGLALLSLSCDGRLRVWRAAVEADGLGLSSTTALAGSLTCGAWRPTGGMLAVGGSHGVYVFRVRNLVAGWAP